MIFETTQMFPQHQIRYCGATVHRGPITAYLQNYHQIIRRCYLHPTWRIQFIVSLLFDDSQKRFTPARSPSKRKTVGHIRHRNLPHNSSSAFWTHKNSIREYEYVFLTSILCPQIPTAQPALVRLQIRIYRAKFDLLRTKHLASSQLRRSTFASKQFKSSTKAITDARV